MGVGLLGKLGVNAQFHVVEASWREIGHAQTHSHNLMVIRALINQFTMKTATLILAQVALLFICFS